MDELSETRSLLREVITINKTLIDESMRIRKENEAYYDAVKNLREELAAERARYDKLMEQMVTLVCQGHKSPLVSIDQR